MTGYVFHPEARRDLDEIWDFISADNIDAADRVISDILRSVRQAVSFPNRGRIRLDLSSRPLRFLFVNEYLVAYTPAEKPLAVIAIIHARRSPRTIAAILRERHFPR
jgi:plasmid stabilization system protein ParE